MKYIVAMYAGFIKKLHNGINSVYKSTKRDPYYYPSAKKRINKYNKNWDKNYFKLKGDDIW